MNQQLRPAIVIFVILTFVTGVLYPLAVTVVSQVVFPYQANGSLETAADGTVVGSALIGQVNSDPAYFWSRPSAINYGIGETAVLTASSGSNFAPSSDALRSAVTERNAAFEEGNALSEAVVVPQDMVFASGSGLDPHISPAAAALQVERVAAARGLEAGRVTELVNQFTEAPQLVIFGQPRVNVLLLNRALDAMDPQ